MRMACPHGLPTCPPPVSHPARLSAHPSAGMMKFLDHCGCQPILLDFGAVASAPAAAAAAGGGTAANGGGKKQAKPKAAPAAASSHAAAAKANVKGKTKLADRKSVV